jgi:hypothetical protein
LLWEGVFYQIAYEKNSLVSVENISSLSDPCGKKFPTKTTEGRTPISGPLSEELPCLISREKKCPLSSLKLCEKDTQPEHLWKELPYLYSCF